MQLENSNNEGETKVSLFSEVAEDGMIVIFCHLLDDEIGIAEDPNTTKVLQKLRKKTVSLLNSPREVPVVTDCESFHRSYSLVHTEGIE